MNHHAKYLGQRPFRAKVTVRTHRHTTHTPVAAHDHQLHWLQLKFSVKERKGQITRSAAAYNLDH